MTQNYVEKFEKYQTGVEASAATGILTMDTQPTATDTVTIGGIVLTFVASGAVAGEVNRGADLAAAKTNLVAAINGTDAINTANPYVTAAAFASNNMTVTARVKGPAGLTIATTETFTAGSNVWAAATLNGAGAHARGTAVPATSVWPYPIAFEGDNVIERAPFALGIGWENAGQDKLAADGAKFSIAELPLVFEVLSILGHWGVKGDVLPTGSAAPFTYTYTVPGTAANPSYVSRTLERRLSDGTNNLDDEWAYSMLTKWGLKWGQRGLVMFSGEGFSRIRKDSTLTPSQTPPALTQIPTSLVTVFVNDTFATMGNTQITGQIVGGEFEYETGNQNEESADGRTDLDFGISEFNPGARRYKLTIKVKVQNGALAFTERAKAKAASIRAVRVRVSDAVSGQSFNIDGLYTHETADGLQTIDRQDGQDIVEFSLVQSTDGTNAFRFTPAINVNHID